MGALLSLAFARQRKGEVNNTDSQRQGKMFSLFSVVQFPNDPCTSTSSISSGSTQYRNGTCYTSSGCGDKGGSVKGGCAAGFGVCCVFMYNDDDKTDVNYNDTYLQNPDYPSVYSETNNIDYTINKVDQDVCWLRLDFETFTTLGPTESDEATGGVCIDMLTITVTSGQSIPVVCGTLTGQHMYLEVGNDASNTARMAMDFTGDSTQRKWEIKVSQFLCGATYAPQSGSGCLQYHTGLTGQITSFNFQNTQSYHLASQDYSVCIRQAAGFCCTEYSVCGDSVENFSFDATIDAATAADQKSMIGTQCSIAIADMTSSGDYITIESSGAQCGETSLSRYCGYKLNPVYEQIESVPVCDCTSPFTVGVHFDAFPEASSAIAGNPNRGFCLDYLQIPC